MEHLTSKEEDEQETTLRNGWRGNTATRKKNHASQPKQNKGKAYLPRSLRAMGQPEGALSPL